MACRSTAVKRPPFDLLGPSRHIIATFILAVCTAFLSIHGGKTSLSAENSSVPNIVLILADDKYEQSAGEAQIPADSAGFLEEFVVFQITAN